MIPTDSRFPFKVKRKQFPIRPCFALTATKSQGQTLSRIGIFCEEPFFSHGQLYVAQSRVGDGDQMKILLSDKGGLTKNVVYKEVL